MKRTLSRMWVAPLALGICLGAVAGVAAQEKPEAATSPQPQLSIGKMPKDLRAFLGKCQKLLAKEENYEALIRFMVTPATLAEMEKSQGGVAQAITEFKGRKAENLKHVLEHVLKSKPQLRADGLYARFDVPKENTDTGRPEKVAFVKADGRWYLEGH